MKLARITAAKLLLAVTSALATSITLAMDTYDVVIIGSGPGGLVAAEYLSRDPSVSVLVLEAGGPSLRATGGTDIPAYATSKHFTKFDIPGEYSYAGSIFSSENAQYRADFTSDQISFLGKLVGGCSSINGALYFRTPDSYADSARWPFSADRMREGFDAIETMFGHTDTPSPDGKQYLQEAYEIVAHAFQQYGQYEEVSLNAASARNRKDKTFGHPPFTIKDGLRDSPAKTFYSAFKDRPNAKLVTHATASYIKQYRGQATGVVYNDHMEVALSKRGAVIMAAGALSTPRVLIQSGIGPRSQLEMLSGRGDFPGVQKGMNGGWVYNENVGHHLFDTQTVFPTFSHPEMKSVVDTTSQSWATGQYMTQNQTGVLAYSGPVLIGYENYDVSGRAYEFQTTIVPNGFSELSHHPSAFFAALYINNPESRDVSAFNGDGKWISSTQHSMVMSSARDVAAMKSYAGKVIEMLRRAGATLVSANEGESVDEWLSRNLYFQTNHFGGSCYASRDAEDTERCADDTLRVVGTRNVFIGDASVMRDGTVNPYGFVMYAGHEAGTMVQAHLAQDAPAATQCSSIALEKDVGYVGLDIDSVASSSVDGCCAKCQATNGCQAFTWTDYNGGTCWLKSSKGETQRESGAISSTVVVMADGETPTPTCANIEDGVDYSGNDVGDVLSATAEGCCSACSAMNGCKAFSWTGFMGGTCWLKSSKGEVVKNPSSRSAVVGGACSAIVEDTDYDGEDVDNEWASKAEDCCAICKTRGDCHAFSWTTFNDGTCWLKSTKGGAVRSAGTRSGYVL